MDLRASFTPRDDDIFVLTQLWQTRTQGSTKGPSPAQCCCVSSAATPGDALTCCLIWGCHRCSDPMRRSSSALEAMLSHSGSMEEVREAEGEGDLEGGDFDPLLSDAAWAQLLLLGGAAAFATTQAVGACQRGHMLGHTHVHAHIHVHAVLCVTGCQKV